MNLSKNFTLEEMTVSEYADRNNLSNKPNDEILGEMKRLAEFLEKVRTIFDRPIHINSAFRSQEVNKAIGGQKNSQHCKGQAADIRIAGFTPDQIVRNIIASGLEYDQVIREFNSWVHLSIPAKNAKARKMALIIDKTGTKPFEQ